MEEYLLSELRVVALRQPLASERMAFLPMFAGSRRGHPKSNVAKDLGGRRARNSEWT
jgi:hypothetical protein